MKRVHVHHRSIEEWRACRECSAPPDDTAAYLLGMMVASALVACAAWGFWLWVGLA